MWNKVELSYPFLADLFVTLLYILEMYPLLCMYAVISYKKLRIVAFYIFIDFRNGNSLDPNSREFIDGIVLRRYGVSYS